MPTGHNNHPNNNSPNIMEERFLPKLGIYYTLEAVLQVLALIAAAQNIMQCSD